MVQATPFVGNISGNVVSTSLSTFNTLTANSEVISTDVITLANITTANITTLSGNLASFSGNVSSNSWVIGSVIYGTTGAIATTFQAPFFLASSQVEAPTLTGNVAGNNVIVTNANITSANITTLSGSSATFSGVVSAANATTAQNLVTLSQANLLYGTANIPANLVVTNLTANANITAANLIGNTATFTGQITAAPAVTTGQLITLGQADNLFFNPNLSDGVTNIVGLKSLYVNNLDLTGISSPPTIIQSQYGLGGTTTSLPNTPTVGNYILMLTTRLTNTPPSGYTSLYTLQFPTLTTYYAQAIGGFYTGGTNPAFTVNGTNWVLFEIGGVASAPNVFGTTTFTISGDNVTYTNGNVGPVNSTVISIVGEDDYTNGAMNALPTGTAAHPALQYDVTSYYFTLANVANVTPTYGFTTSSTPTPQAALTVVFSGEFGTAASLTPQIPTNINGTSAGSFQTINITSSGSPSASITSNVLSLNLGSSSSVPANLVVNNLTVNSSITSANVTVTGNLNLNAIVETVALTPIANLIHTSSTDPRGININFTNASVNNKTDQYIGFLDNASTTYKTVVWSDGSIEHPNIGLNGFSLSDFQQLAITNSTAQNYCIATCTNTAVNPIVATYNILYYIGPGKQQYMTVQAGFHKGETTNGYLTVISNYAKNGLVLLSNPGFYIDSSGNGYFTINVIPNPTSGNNGNLYVQASGYGTALTLGANLANANVLLTNVSVTTLTTQSGPIFTNFTANGNVLLTTANITTANVSVANISSATISNLVSANAIITSSNITNANITTITGTSGIWIGNVSAGNLNASTVTANVVGNIVATTGSFSGLITPTSTVGIKGTTAGDSVQAGSFGEVLSATLASGSAVSLTTGTALNVITLSLTAGDWDVWGTVAMTPSSTVTNLAVGVSSVSATIPAATTGGVTQLALAFTSATQQITQTGMTRINISATTNVYLVAKLTFAGTCTAFGSIFARRAR